MSPAQQLCCGRIGRCGWASLVLLGCGLATAVVLRFQAGLDLWAVHPVHGGSGEESWAAMHWIGLSNLAMLVGWLPGYSQVRMAAPARVGRVPRVAFTFDDAIGLNASGASELLDLLDEFKVKATFFVIANEEYTLGGSKPAVLKEIVQRGHEVGNHGIEDAGMNFMDEATVEATLVAWEHRVQAVVGPWPVQAEDQKWFRPPKGAMSDTLARVLDRKGYHAVLGDVISNDWQNEDIAYHVDVIRTLARDGSVVILHCPDRPERLQTLAVMKRVLPYLSTAGFEFVRLSTLFASHGRAIAQLGGTCESCMVMVGIASLSWCLAVVCSIVHAFRIAANVLAQKRQDEGELQTKEFMPV